MNTKQLDNKYIAHAYGRADLELCKAQGSFVYDNEGREYIDLGSGIAVNIFGGCDEKWQKAVCDQACSIQHASNYYYTKPQSVLAQMLCERTGMKKVFFGNSGAEANECAIKAARKYSFDKYGEGRSTIITLRQSFHGRTVTTLTATGQDSLHNFFMPFTPGFEYVEPGDIKAIDDAIAKGGCCAVMMELIQGEGGVNPLDKEYAAYVVEAAKANDILVIIDEVQSGNGRTGMLYSFMNYGILPDIFTTAKGLGGGLPIGVCVFGEKVENVLTPGTHGSTFGGNPVVCAGAVSIFERIDDRLMDEVAAKGNLIKEMLRGAKNVESVTGMGLMIGIKTTKDAHEIMDKCRERGVLVLTAKDRVRLLPALNIPAELLTKAVGIVKEVIEE
ncbi:MAG: acetylornithine/succinylornithine family transaminase [Clostridia bacterium]|nr:acetylornithine/succinylornithine family transaminase [Clostridia bacterium]